MGTVTIKGLIGDYEAFFADLLGRLKEVGVTIEGMPLTHLLYRTSTTSEYEELRDALKKVCREYVETSFNGRAVSILILKEPLALVDGFEVSMIELPAPRPAHMYPSGLESIGVFVGNDLEPFKKEYEKILTGIKDHGEICKPAFITFENEKTVKFYDHTLKEIVLWEGWRFEQLSEPSASPTNKMVSLTNAWMRYFYTVDDWRDLIKGVTPKDTSCGPVHELENPIDRPNESFAIADMRDIKVAAPHFHKNGETEVYFVLQGKGITVVGGKEIPIGKNSVIMTPPDIAHFTIPEKDLVLGVMNTPPFNSANNVDLTESNKSVGFDRNQFEKFDVLKKRPDNTILNITFDDAYDHLNETERGVMQNLMKIDPTAYGFKGEWLGITEVPTDLIAVKGQVCVKSGKEHVITTQYLPRHVFDSYKRCNDAIIRDLGKPLLVDSGYRSSVYQAFVLIYRLQQNEFDLQKTLNEVAMPGYSEHGFPPRQAIDFITTDGIPSSKEVRAFDQTSEYGWLLKNADTFHFHLSYPKNNPHGIMFEPWHWHYER